MKITKQRIIDVGYTDIRRISAIDAHTCDLNEEWKKVGSPKFALHTPDFVKYTGTQCCLLSWMKTLDYIICENIPFATVFEDDVMFHKDFVSLAPSFYENTPRDFHLCYTGAQIDTNNPSAICEISSSPAFCTHAIMFTLEGARVIRDYILKFPQGVYTIDCMLKEAEEGRFGKCPFKFYVWNAMAFSDPARVMPQDWTKRNHGLVYQDYYLGTFVRDWSAS
jgi:hypothetical protein